MVRKLCGCGGALVLSAAAVITACSMGDQPGDGDRSGGLTAVRFASGSIAAVQDAAATRARVAGNLWETGDAIGIFMVNHSSNPPAVVGSSKNIEYSTTSTLTNGAFTHQGNSTIYYPVDDTNMVDFFAYYPYQGTLTTDWIYPVNVSDQSTQQAIDLMWTDRVNDSGGGGNGYNKNSGPITLPFDHQLVKLVFDITAGGAGEDVAELFTAPEGLTVQITGQKATGDFDLRDGGLTAAGNLTEIMALTSVSNGTTAASEAIVLPNTGVTGMKFWFTTSAGTYEVDVPTPINTNSQWEPKYQYTYTVTLKRYGVDISGSVTPWNSGSTHTVDGVPQ